MQKLVTILLGTTTLLVGCAPEPKGSADWRLNGGCEKYFTVTSREYADCKAFVATEEAKKTAAASTGTKTIAKKGMAAPSEGNASVSLDPVGAYMKEDYGEKENRDTDITLTN